MLDELLQLNARAAAAGEFEVAYHLLMAALHAADHAQDQAVLDRITALAREQGAAVEAVQPSHHLARSQAQSRGQTSVFDSLLTHVDAVRLRLQSTQQRGKHHL